jgi:hypothetical protein
MLQVVFLIDVYIGGLSAAAVFGVSIHKEIIYALALCMIFAQTAAGREQIVGAGVVGDNGT